MSQDIQNQNKDVAFLNSAQQNSGLAITMGILLLLIGLLAIASPFIAGLSVTVLVGMLLIIGGIGQLIFSIKAGKGSFGIIVLGLLTLIAGLYMVSKPGVALATLTLILAAYLLVAGIFDIILSFQIKPLKGWGWELFIGIISLLLGLMIWRQFPLSGTWAIGILLGLRLFFSGWALLMFGLIARNPSASTGSSAQ